MRHHLLGRFRFGITPIGLIRRLGRACAAVGHQWTQDAHMLSGGCASLDGPGCYPGSQYGNCAECHAEGIGRKSWSGWLVRYFFQASAWSRVMMCWSWGGMVGLSCTGLCSKALRSSVYRYLPCCKLQRQRYFVTSYLLLLFGQGCGLSQFCVIPVCLTKIVHMSHSV